MAPLATVTLAAILIATCFTMAGGTPVEQTTMPAIGLTALGGLTVASAIFLAPREVRLWGGITLLLFAALVAVTAVSITWSIEPSGTWVYANLLFSYLAVFAGAVAAVRVAADRWSAVIGAVVIAALVVSGYSLITKIFPSLDPLDVARVRAPFDYWNAVGLMAALGVPGTLWLGARRDGHAALRALSVPALTVLLVSVLLSFGRGAVLVTLTVVVLWFAIVPLRLRSAAVLGTATVGAAIVGIWSLANDALSVDGIPRDVRTDAGLDLGLLLLPVLVLMLLAGLGVAFAASRATVSPHRRRTVGAVLLVAVALLPLAGVAKLATSDRGLTGSISQGWKRLTDPGSAQPGNDPSRLAEVGGVRARYWDDAFKIWSWSRWTGTGGDTFGAARRPLQVDKYRAGHAHGYVPQTLADLGWVGAGVSGLLLVAWLVAALRTTGLHPRGRPLAWARSVIERRSLSVPLPKQPPQRWTAERIGVTALALTAVAFGLHSAIDWTWFIPGTAITGLLCAAWVAGRGPLQPAEPLPAPAGVERPQRSFRAALAATAIVIAAAASWSIWQPLRAIEAEDAALSALADGHLAAARAHAEDAIAINPLAVGPLLTLAAIEEVGRRPAVARTALERAVDLQPANPEAWLALGQFHLDRGHYRVAARTFSAAVYLDRFSQQAQRKLAEAQRLAGIAPPPA